MYCRSDGTEEVLSCIRCGILQAADAVYLTVVLRDVAYVSSEQSVLHFSEPSAISLSVSQADRPRRSCNNQGGR